MHPRRKRLPRMSPRPRCRRRHRWRRASGRSGRRPSRRRDLIGWWELRMRDGGWRCREGVVHRICEARFRARHLPRVRLWRRGRTREARWRAPDGAWSVEASPPDDAIGGRERRTMCRDWRGEIGVTGVGVVQSFYWRNCNTSLWRGEIEVTVQGVGIVQTFAVATLTFDVATVTRVRVSTSRARGLRPVKCGVGGHESEGLDAGA